MFIDYKEIRDEKRVIIISDIHGDLALLEKLLLQISYQDQDVLIVNGDMCEKGPNSLSVLRYMMKRSIQSKKVYVTQGNCDVLINYVLNKDEWILDYMKRQEHSLLNDMLAEHEASLDDFTSINELSAFYQEHFEREINWLLNLPTAIETEDYIIIHAGIENREDWKETSVQSALSIPAFYEKEHQANKLVVVGHWPVSNYTATSESHNNPLIDLNKKIICIDGGNRVKNGGQINALLIQNGTYRYTYVDHLLDTRKVQKAYEAPIGYVGTVTYPNYQLRKLIEEKYFTLCENINLGMNQWIKNEYIQVEDNNVFCKGDLSTTLLSVKVGDIVSIMDESCEGYVLVKKAGEVGWIPSECL